MNLFSMLGFYVDMGDEDYQSEPWTLTKIIIVLGHITLSYGLAWATAHIAIPKWASSWNERRVSLTVAWVFILMVIRWVLPKI